MACGQVVAGGRVSLGQRYDSLLGVPSEIANDLADGVNALGPATLRDFLRQRGPRFAIDAQLDLDQFVVIQRGLDLGHHVIGQTLVGHDDHGLERVRQAAEVLPLARVEWHTVLPDVANCQGSEV
jgi:hypothetical protein